MKLLLDVGNSCLKWAVAVDSRIVQQGRLGLQDVKPPEVLASLQHLNGNVSPDEIRIANVTGPERGRGLDDALKACFGAPIVHARSPAAGAGVRNGYREPAQLGIDRWLALCAAYSADPGVPACVVDAGTATTLDVVTGDGIHRGGLILPGLDLMEASLRRGTGDLDRLARQLAPASQVSGAGMDTGCFGRDTAEAIQLGALRATAGLVDACMAAVAGEASGGRARLVLTGGNAPRILSLLKFSAEHRPALVLEGLALDPPCFASAG